MRITCPRCGMRYDAPDGEATPGREVRCIGCGTVWAPVASGLGAADGRSAPVGGVPDPGRDASAAGPAPVRVPELSRVPEPAPRRGAEPEPGPWRVVGPEPGPWRVAGPSPSRDPDPGARVVVGARPEADVWPFAPMLPPKPRRRVTGLSIAWLSTLVVLSLAVAAFVLYQHDIEQSWPPSGRIYGVLGLSG